MASVPFSFMLRFVVILLASVLLISVLRSIIGIIMHGLSELLKGNPSSSPSSQQSQRRAAEIPVSGELKKDPICGTFVSTATNFKKATAAGTIYFCSAECRDKHRG